MEIVGRGFIARNLEPIAGSHPQTVVFAAGVSSGSNASTEDFGREAALLYDVIEYCLARRRRLVYLSTASKGMYGLRGPLGWERGPVYPSTPYARHKLSMEAVLCHSGLDHLILRMAHLVGPCQRPHQFPPALVRQILAGTVHVHRGVSRDLIDVADMVMCLDRLLTLGVSREVVNIASGVSIPVETVVAHLERRLGVLADKYLVDVRDEGSHGISIDRLTELVPEVKTCGFGPDYYIGVFDKYLLGYVAQAQRPPVAQAR
ncbi:NAD-dependent epimerase/dehydratase family protein [Sphaerisporangium perillae]|uniref:NAD-dependent epimerase/dehydratase family protein n=1 Tax=Sphaerisporangium perillae TaxID=2935860 RepID=UPI0020100212|nr:NAD-dependent epimerase/dehydratase family protein [Sphaerisporangium perillae]